jgi:hypothetical protein
MSLHLCLDITPLSILSTFFHKKTIRMTKNVPWAFFAFFAMLFGIFPFVFLIKGMKFGVEETKDITLYANLAYFILQKKEKHALVTS